MDHASEYSRKLVSPQEAVRVVKSGDWVQYGHHANSPVYLDGFLAKRKDELSDVKVCAVDETWSGLKLVVRREARAAPLRRPTTRLKGTTAARRAPRP